MTTTSAGHGLTIALAGGTGAFLGALVGQLVQWARERQAEKGVERRRDEDREAAAVDARRIRRHDDYVKILTFAQKLDTKLQRLEFHSRVMAMSSAHNPVGHDHLEGLEREVKVLIAKRLPDASARAEMMGSAELRRLFVQLNSDLVRTASASWGNLENQVGYMTDEAFAEYRRQCESGEDVDIRNFLSTKQIEWSDVYEDVNQSVAGIKKSVDSVRQEVRRELDLES